jgi:hypothetical protein
MKLEMRALDMDVKLELEDHDGVADQLEILSVVKSLLETLDEFEKVNVSIVKNEKHDNEVHHVEVHTDEKVETEVEAGDFRFSVAA